MSVLSFSVQYAGEQSPGTKAAEDILEETQLLQIDCPHQSERDKLSHAIVDSKKIFLEADQARQLAEEDLLNSKHREDDALCSSLRPISELCNGVHAAEKTLVKAECSQICQEDQSLSKKHEESTSFQKMHSPQMMTCNISNAISEAEASVPKEDLCKGESGRWSAELHSFSNSLYKKNGSCREQNHVIELVKTSYKLSDYTEHTEDSRRDEMNEGEKTTDVSSSATSNITDTPDFCEEGKNQVTTVHEQLDLACRTDFGPSSLSVSGQNNDLSSPGNALREIVHKVESDRGNCNQEGESSPSGTEYVEDHTVPLWIKWRGKWQTGFQCPRVDCPLPTLRAKPTHERKKYVAIFFPRTRTYSWADMLLVRPINEFPEPLVSGTHRKWRKLVKDVTTPRRYIMQKLAVAMLNMSDQLHTEVVIENARKATTWKEFAMEASHCRDYSDLGRMLLKLQTMILPPYVCNAWLEKSFNSWMQRCQSAQSAESVEILTEELVASVQWNAVDELWSAPVQPELGPEWKTWKQEAMKWFSTSHPIATSGNVEQRNGEISVAMDPEVSRKRLKLEVRRAESCASQMEAPNRRILSQAKRLDTDCLHSMCQAITPACEPHKVQELSGATAMVEYVSMADRWDKAPMEVEDIKFIQSSEVTSAGGSGKIAMVNTPYMSDATNKYRQCLAFVAAKGRQCGRWASDGDVYCCVHLNTRSVGKLSREQQRPPPGSPMCEGMTTHGNKCKHRARFGSSFCKKHRLQKSHDSMKIDNFSTSSCNKLKRKCDENNALEIVSSSNASDAEELRLVAEFGTSVQENLIPIVVGETLDERNCLMKESDLYSALPAPTRPTSPDLPCCIGSYGQNNGEQCLENAKRHTLYCEKHLPKFLKRARNGKSRLVSKDVFINLLRNCSSRKQKMYLHQACELLYGFMKSSLSRQKSVFKGDIMGWILSEASKDLNVGDYLLKLVCSEREKITRLWGFSTNKDKQASSSETKALVPVEMYGKDQGSETAVKCKICAAEFSDDQTLGTHWTEIHKKEARWLFRGYACAVCMSSFTNRKVLEMHVKERHGVQFLEHSILFRCMSCSSHFVNPEHLWQHVLSFHLTEFRMQDLSQQLPQDQLDQPKMIVAGGKLCQNNCISEKDDGSRYICRLCGLKFDLLPDLGRHHQVAHMNPSSTSRFPPKRGNHYIKPRRRGHSRFKKNFGSAYRFKKPGFGMQKHLRSTNSAFSVRPRLKSEASETMVLGRLLESHCSDVAETLFSEMQKTKPRPSNPEILSIARSACCRISLHIALEVKYGKLTDNLYLKAAKLCSELNIQVDWHQEGFVCPKGCKPLMNPHSLGPVEPLPDGILAPSSPSMSSMNDIKWEMEECHYVLHPKNFNWTPMRETIILCEDVSFGKELVPVACVIDEDLRDSLDEASCSEKPGTPMPWQGFTYVTKRLIEPSLGIDNKNSQLGCACPHPVCYPEKCDHVYLFDNDYENAEDIHGKSMRGRFPYDERGRLVLEEGYLVYECNSSCNCDATCHNRVLQKGVQVKLEIFRTEKKGWAVRTREAILRGTFVCEYIGEVLNDEKANKREKRYDDNGCSYVYDIDAHIDGARGLSEETVPYVIDASKYGNIARFINHSCSPNLVNYLVLVEGMDCQLAHIGLYANRDIDAGEELAYDYRHKLLPGDGHPCHCGTSNCRGRLY